MNEAINKEIFKVCTHKYKKECEKAHENVKRAGYNITKFNGRFIVSNEKTQKSVSIKLPENKYENTYVLYDTGRKRAKCNNGEIPKFDFKNYLDKPKNKEKNIIVNNKYRHIRYEIKNEKYYIKMAEKYVEKAKEEINQAIEKLERETRLLQNHKNRLDNIRKEIKNL